MLLSDNIISIKNIGEERSKKLQKLGVFTVNDLIEYFPRDYDDRSNVCKIKDIELNKINTVKGKVISKPETTKIKNISITKIRIDDNTGFLEIVWFNQPYLKNTIKYKSDYIFTGKIIQKYGRTQMESPDYEIIDERELLSSGRIVPIYASTYKFSQKLFREVINQTLSNVKEQIKEFLPDEILTQNNLCSRKFAIENIHFPKDNKSFFIARRRLVFEELFLLQTKLLQIKGILEHKKCNVNIKNTNITPILNMLPFKLTDAQNNVLKEILEDLNKDKAMNRLIQGDVGSGKTVIAQILAYITVNNGYQVAIMAPTDVLASQHFEGFKAIFDNLNIKCVFLSGNQKAKEKRENYALIQSGEAKIIVGTHAIIQDKVVFNNLGAVITDEQHRFGVKQREILSQKGENPHTLVMTATPIPRTLALILYGDLDISTIDKLPPGRQKIDTIFVNSTYYPRIYNFIKKNADEKRQSYIICPMIEENEKMELKAVLSYTEQLKNEIFINYSVECIHGKMKNAEKQEIMDNFYKGKIDILVSTTVIEVGINVPNATIMIIENAERFGISQLHQLRGRVGRGSDKSYCVLVSDSKSKQSKQRLDTMVKHSDGFILSEKDLELRGTGDFFGTRQHGVPDMKIANLYKDMEILKQVQKASITLYKKDPLLIDNINKPLKEKIDQFFNTINNTVSL
ncbi:ATP-dependent DNA helicase RecG [uncultured Tyzzerella sp.]|uniref:ATP-dependent DNA helicase RecG n=1 Tax=uncultured Tyzzerella sp. TaxID=2321398 RepID=UPI002941D008|nr:ATP-dependent DNA helicase RecG [uncultured Tyzzerella sp.]